MTTAAQAHPGGHDVVVVGPASWNQLVEVDRLPEPVPHMQVAQGSHRTTGGTSAGKALHLAELGRDALLATVVGTDDVAPLVTGPLRAAGVPLLAAVVDGPTEQHLNLMAPDGGRVSIYLATPGTPGPAADERVLDAVREARVAVVDLSPRGAALLDDVAATGVPVWTDLHDHDGVAEFHRPFLEAASWVFCSGDRLGDPWAFLRHVATAGRTAVCTLGAEGAIAVGPDGTEHHVRAAPVAQVVDTNGAGDAFVAGALHATLDGAPLAAALAAGATQAARALTTPHLCHLLDGLVPA